MNFFASQLARLDYDILQGSASEVSHTIVRRGAIGEVIGAVLEVIVGGIGGFLVGGSPGAAAGAGLFAASGPNIGLGIELTKKKA